MGFHFKYDTANVRYQLHFRPYIEVVEVCEQISSKTIKGIYDHKLYCLKKALHHFENVETRAKITYTGIEDKLSLKASVTIECEDESFKKILEAVTHKFAAIFIPG